MHVVGIGRRVCANRCHAAPEVCGPDSAQGGRAGGGNFRCNSGGNFGGQASRHAGPYACY
jgi:hypothetical protein